MRRLKMMFKRVIGIALGLLTWISTISTGSLLAPALAQTSEATRPRQTNSTAPAAEATVTLNEQFLNALLEVMFTRLRAPSYPLSLGIVQKSPNRNETAGKNPPATKAVSGAAEGGCASVVVLEREMDGVKTAVHFEQGRIVAPLAFTGSYNTGLLGCMKFQGWADTNIKLEFDHARQALNARVDIVDVHLKGIPLLANGVVVDMVQSAIDQRVNPIEILRTEQLTARVPISAAGGALRLRAKELRPEITPGLLKLHIIYEFTPAE
jgi:hypothetical protein